MKVLGASESETYSKGTARARTPIQASVLRAWGAATDDPDAATLAEWLDHGAPLGFRDQIPCNRVFPRVEEATSGPPQLEDTLDLQGWTNYSSAEEAPEVLNKLIDEYVARGFCHEVPDLETAAKELGVEPVLNKLGIVTKTAEDGTVKHRIIWDMKASSANNSCSQAERIVLPRLLDLAEAASHIYRTGGIPWVLAVDVRDAFLNIPAGRDKSMSVAVRPDASGRNKLIICDTLVFGSKSSPTIWGRYASWLGRSWASIIHECCFQIYVDDPAIVAKGTFQQAASQVTCALLWAAVAGFPLKLSKAMGGKRIKWIGATITLDDDKSEVVVSIPSDKRAKLLEQCLDIAKKPVVSQKKLSALTGGLSFVAGLIPHLRPFLDTFWAALSSPLTKSANDGVGRPSGKLIHVRRFETGLQWVVALLQGDKVPLARTLKPICENIEAEVTTDASPWGLGGVLRVGGQLTAAFGCPLSDQLLTKFRARAGDPKYTTLWEAVALLTAFRLWLPQIKFRAHIRIKADSLSSLTMIAKGRAKSLELNVVAREIALDQAFQEYGLTILTHIPGVTNLEADYLSRLFSPKPPVKPGQLEGVPLTPVQHGAGFWKVVKLTNNR